MEIKFTNFLVYTISFENFIEGDCNRLARSAGYAVSNKPGGTSFNPLHIYGNTGLGKTHLVHAIGIEIKNTHPNKTVLYVPADRFMNQFVDAVKNNSTNDFIHFYQMMDVLIIDDVVTTGATFLAATAALVAVGAISVVCVAPSRTV